MKRFYSDVAVAEGDGGWLVLLDGRAIKTAGGRRQIVSGQALAKAMALEWSEQGELIDPARFIFRDTADYALDVVAQNRTDAVQRLLPYGETDTLCYRAEPGEALLERQMEVWEPLLLAAEQRWDIHFARISGVIHRPQPAATLARLEKVLAAQDDFSLAALRTLAGLAASLVIGLAAIEPGANVAALWDAASLEEDWQAELWGKDAEAAALRETRLLAFEAGVRFVELVRR